METDMVAAKITNSSTIKCMYYMHTQSVSLTKPK